MKIMIIIRDVLVWKATLFFILMKIQKIFFFIFCAMNFKPTNSALYIANLGFSITFLLIFIIWFIKLLTNIRFFVKFSAFEGYGEKNIKKNSVLTEKNQSNFNSSTHINTPKTTHNSVQIIPPSTFKRNHVENEIMNNIITENNEIYKVSENKDLKKSNFIVRLLSKISQIKFLFSTKNPDSFLGRYKFVYFNFKTEHSYQKYYLVMFCIRQCFMSIFSVIFYEHPLLQISILNICNFSFIIYIILLQPFKSRLYFSISLVSEIITCLAFVAGLILAIFDSLQLENYESRNDCGWIIIFCNLILLYWVVLTASLKPFYLKVLNIFLKRKYSRRVHIQN